jgi:hypothetical protein
LAIITIQTMPAISWAQRTEGRVAAGTLEYAILDSSLR